MRLLFKKINAAWTISENLFEEMFDSESMIVVIIERNGKVQKRWFEKKPGNALYDQSAIRAIKRAELSILPRIERC